jgi:predicted phosphodiesterase
LSRTFTPIATLSKRFRNRTTSACAWAIWSDADHRYLNDLPTTELLKIDGKKFLMVHATPRDPLDEYTSPNPNDWAPRLAGVDADFVLVGHTHQQFSIPVGRTTVVNPGAVGLPRDGDPNVRYAIIENGRVELKSCPYPVEKTVAAMMDDPTLDDRARSMLADVYRTGRLTQLPATNGVHHSPKDDLVNLDLV